MRTVILLFSTVILLPAWAESVSLNDLQVMALKNSFSVKSKEADLKISEASTAIARSRFYPNFGIQVEKDLDDLGSGNNLEVYASIYGEINLFNGFKDKSLMKKRKITEKYLKDSFENFKFSLQLEVEEIFYRYLYSRKKLKSILDEQKRTRRHSRLVKKRSSSNLLTESDIIEFRLYQKKNKSLENYLKLEKAQLLSRIQTITGVKSLNDSKIFGEIPHIKLVSSLDSLMSSINKGPRLLELKKNFELSKVDKLFENSGWYPSVDIRAEYGKIDDIYTGIHSNDLSSKLTLSASWEFFSGFKTVSRKELQKNNKIKIDYTRKQAEQDLEIVVNSDFHALKMLEKTIEFEEENERLTQRLYIKTLEEYKKGIKDSGALIESSKAIREALNRVFKLKLDYILTKISLEKSLGRSLDFTLVHH